MIPIWFFTGIAAFLLAGCAAYFSITGLAALYAASFIPVIIMASTIEFGKIVATFWLHQHYKTASKFCVTSLFVLVLMAMSITSGGVYGFLTKGHIDQEIPLINVYLEIEQIDNKIKTQQNVIDRAQNKINQLDDIIKTLVEYDKISGPDGARAVRNKQEEERKALAEIIDSAEKEISNLNDQKFTLQQNISTVESKLGPVKYLAALFGADTDKAVQYFTLLIVLLLDPFAILLVVATSINMNAWREQKLKKWSYQINNNLSEKNNDELIDENTKDYKAPLTMDTLTEFLEDDEVQQQLIDDPELINEVEKIIELVNTKKANGWIDKDTKIIGPKN